MAKDKLDREEQDVLDAYEADGLGSDLTHERKEQLANAARETLKKDKRMNIRISSCDMEALQRRGLEEGLPYQSLVSSVLHKYVSGGFKDVSAHKPAPRTPYRRR